MHISRVTRATEELVIACDRLIPQLTRRPVPTPDDLSALIDSPSVLLIARTSDQSSPIIGAGTLGIFRTPTGLHAHIEDIIVDQSLRGQGIGKALVSQLLNVANEMNLDGVSLTCNPTREAANKMYEKMGFTKWETNVFWYDLKK
jgi:ribosomal protein S18 acetylase RimI-like enzyme